MELIKKSKVKGQNCNLQVKNLGLISDSRFKIRISENTIAVLLVTAVVLYRVVPYLLTNHLGNNIAPVAALALFGGTYLTKKYALILPLAAMAASDVIIGLHSTVLFTWGSFVLIALLGLWLRKNKNIGNIVFVSLTGSLLFYFVTNFGVWMMMSMYPKTVQGLLECYVMAIPFFRNTLVGDAIFVVALFGAYELAVNFAHGWQKELVKENI